MKYIWIFFALLIVMPLGLPVAYAQVELPDTQQLLDVEAYRSVLELEDTLYLIRYKLEYGTSPDDPIDNTYIFRLRNTATGLLYGSTTAYGFYDGGYDNGIASIYFSQADAPTWSGAYSMYFDGNPSLHWFDSTATTAMVGAVADDGGVQTDETAESNSVAANDMTLLPAGPAVGDAYYFGSDRMFTILTLNIGTQGTPVYNPGVAGWTGEWEYWDGDSWEEISGVTDETVGFTAAVGNHDVYFDIEDANNWNASDVNGITAYWVRYRVTAFNSVVAQPLGTQSWTNTVDPPSINTASIDWFDEGSVSDAQDRLTTRLRAIATQLETDWGGTTDLIEDSAAGKVLTTTGEEYFTNSIVNLRSICPGLFYQQMMPVEYEHDILVTDGLSTGDDATVNVWGNNWVAQTFVPSERYDITGLNVLVSRTGNPGNFTVSLRATLAGAPTGADLASGVVDGDAFTIDDDGEWIALAFTDDYTLTAGTTYALCARSVGVNVNNRVNWFVDTGNGYAGGSEYTNNAAGVGAWNQVAANDMLFEILARGGVTTRAGRMEGRLGGTTFDISQWAANWAISTMWLNTILWVAMMFVLCWAFALASNSWDGTMLLIAGCTAIGWRAGFVDTIFMALLIAVLAIGAIYAAFWKKSY